MKLTCNRLLVPLISPENPLLLLAPTFDPVGAIFSYVPPLMLLYTVIKACRLIAWVLTSPLNSKSILLEAAVGVIVTDLLLSINVLELNVCLVVLRPWTIWIIFPAPMPVPDTPLLVIL